MLHYLLSYKPTEEDFNIVAGGVFVVLLIAYLFTKYSRYGGGSNYGMTDDFDDDYHDFDDDSD